MRRTTTSDLTVKIRIVPKILMVYHHVIIIMLCDGVQLHSHRMNEMFIARNTSITSHGS